MKNLNILKFYTKQRKGAKRDLSEVRIFETDVRKLKKICDKKETENLAFRMFVKSGEFDQKKFNKIVAEVEKQINCFACANCCKVLSITLTEKDIRRIAYHLKISRAEFLRKYVVINKFNEFALNQKPCVFLENNKCKLSDIKPMNCKSYPHLKKELASRTLQLLANAEVCPLVFNALENAKKILWGYGKT